MNTDMKKRAEEVIVLLRKMFGEDMDFICADSYRTNVITTSIALRMPHCDTLPTIYMEDMPENASVEEIANIAAARFQEILRDIDGQDIDEQDYPSMTRESVLENVVFQAIGRKRNRQLLRNHPHFYCLDLAGVFRIPVGEYGKGYLSSILLSNPLAEAMGLTTEELTEAAKRNTLHKFGVELINAGEKSRYIMQGLPYPEEPFEAVQMTQPGIYILTNRIGINGAANMLIPEILEQISEKAGVNYYILPSSIHELLIVRDEDSSLPRQQFKEITYERNRSERIDPDNVLTDNIYYYTYHNKTLQVV